MKCCVSTDVGTRTNWLTFEPDLDYSPDAGTGLLSPISYKRCYAEFYVGKIPRIRIGGPPLQRGVVLKWFYSLSRRNTFVGGTCALPSALLVVAASDLPLYTIKFCYVVFGVTMRLLVINISSPVSREQQTTPLTATSVECHQLAIWRSNGWQHAMKPDIGR